MRLFTGAIYLGVIITAMVWLLTGCIYTGGGGGYYRHPVYSSYDSPGLRQLREFQRDEEMRSIAQSQREIAGAAIDRDSLPALPVGPLRYRY